MYNTQEVMKKHRWIIGNVLCFPLNMWLLCSILVVCSSMYEQRWILGNQCLKLIEFERLHINPKNSTR
jgi:hypothetical protein